jgi:tetratricopeptide (TPR) repeat protein
MGSVDELLRQALELHRAGQLAEAERLYRQILAAAPTHAPTLHMMGVLAAQNHQADEAIAYFGQAIASNPGQPAYHHGLGELYRERRQTGQARECFERALRLDAKFAIAHFSLGLLCQQEEDWNGAVAAFREVVRLKPDMAEAHHELGELFRKLGRREEALECFRRALACRGESAEAHINLGSLLQEMGRLDEAIALLQTATRLRPDLMPAHFNLGNALRLAGRYAAAAASYRQAIALAPEFAQAHNNLGSVLRTMGDLQGAEAAFSDALRYAPESAEAHHNLGMLMKNAGRLAEARDSLSRAIELDPHYAPSQFNLGSVFLKLRQWNQARRVYHEALRLWPNYAEPHCSLGLLCMATGQHDEALAHYDAALAIRPDIPEAHCDRGMLLLSGGDDDAGWPEFEWFTKSDAYLGRKLPQPAWDGSPLAGRTLLVLCDQSLGDTIQFVRFLPWLRETGQGTVLLAAQKALHPLLNESGFEGLVSLDAATLAFDVHTSIMMLPALFFAAHKSIDAPLPYLRASGELVERWRARIAALDGFKIGICWQGNPEYPWDEFRSIPLAEFAPLGEVPGVCLIGLQHGAGREQLPAFAERCAVVDFGDQLDRDTGAFMDTAAIIKNLDLVITSDTSTAHLAGALGADVWVALSRAPEFRWMRSGEACRWYPTMRLFRQQEMGDWAGVFKAMAARLKSMTQNNRARD